MSELKKIKKNILEIIKSNNSLYLEKKTKEAFDSFPDDIDIIQYYAVSLLQNNKKKDSIDIFKLAISKKKELIAPYLNIAKIYHSLNDFKNAELYYEKAINISNRKTQILLDASQFYKKNNINKCEQLLVEAARKEQDNINVLLAISEFYFEIKDYFLAISFLLKADKIDKKIFHIKFLLGLCFLEVENASQSKKYFEECLYLNNNSIEAYQNLIYLNYIQGNKEIANKLIVRAFKLDDLNPKVVEIYVLLNKFQLNDHFVKKLEDRYLSEIKIQSKIIYGFALAKIYDENNSLDKFKLYLNDSNAEKRNLFSNYNFESHLGQFDYLRKFFNQDFFMKNYSNESVINQIINPIFIVGMPRSGSTLIEQIISSHSKVLSLGEVDYFSESIAEVIKSNDVEEFCQQFNNNKSLFIDIAKSYIRKVNKLNFDKKKIILQIKCC